MAEYNAKIIITAVDKASKALNNIQKAISKTTGVTNNLKNISKTLSASFASSLGNIKDNFGKLGLTAKNIFGKISSAFRGVMKALRSISKLYLKAVTFEFKIMAKTVSAIFKGLKKGAEISFKGMVGAARIAAKGIKTAFNLAVKGVKLLTGAVAAGSAALYALGNRGGKYLDLQRGFIRNYGRDAVKNLKILRKAAGGTISDFDLMASANKAAMLNITKNTKILARLLMIARIRGKEMGEDTTKAFNDIVIGIGRMSPLILDNLGIILPHSLKKSISKMSDFKKKQVILNYVLKDGNRILRQYGKSIDSTRDSYLRIQATAINLKDTLATKVGPAFAPIVDKVNAFLNKIGEKLDTIKTKDLKNVFQSIANTLDWLVTGAINRFQQAWDLLNKGIEKIGGWDAVKNAIIGMGNAINDFMNSAGGIFMNILNSIINTINKWVQSIGGWNVIKQFFIDLGNRMSYFASGAVGKFMRIMNSVIDTINRWVQSIGGWGVIKDFIVKTFDAITNAVKKAWDFLKWLFDLLFGAIEEADKKGKIGLILLSILDDLRVTFENLADAINTVFDFLSDEDNQNTIETIIGYIIIGIVYTAKIISMIGRLGSRLIDFLAPAFGIIINVIKTVVSVLWSVLTTVYTVIDRIIFYVGWFIGTLLSVLVMPFDAIMYGIQLAVAGMVTKFIEWLNKIRPAIGIVIQALNMLKTDGSTIFGKFINKIIGYVQKVLGWLDKLGGKINSVKEQYNKMKEQVKARFTIKWPENPFKKHALGGTVTTPFQIVGEQGPELAAFPIGTKIFTASETRSILKTVNNSPNVNINVSINASEDDIVQRLKDRIIDVLKTIKYEEHLRYD